MGKLVQPEVFLVGYTVLDMRGMVNYLRASGNQDFVHAITAAREDGLSDGEILVSFYAKLCYLTHTEGKNPNVTRIRSIHDNLIGCINSGHLSVFEHVMLNFAVHNCSRVYEVELVRHRVGTAFSIESGRYCRKDTFDLVFDPILEPVRDDIIALHKGIEVEYNRMAKKMGLDTMTDFVSKKKITSALRCILPEGKAKEVGFSINLRALRHTVQLRTSRHAEWQIRDVFGQVYRLVKGKYPLLFHGAKEEVVDDLLEVSGMRMQPYEKE